ncbi:MAG: hypothetical protein RIT11_805 [Pseudomonadota bacterium]
MGGPIPNPFKSKPTPPAPAPAPVAVAAPTTAEVSQAGATEMDNKGIKRRRRGRSMTILTGSTGVQEGATLGTPTLLG